MAGYELPAAIVLVDELPLSPNGKVDVAALPASASVGAAGGTAAAPGDVLERKLLRIWSEVLEVKVGPEDDFFDLGGHSLMAVNLFAAIETEMGLRLPLSTIFEAPTVRQLAEVLRSNGWATPWRSLAALSTTGSRPPVFFVTAGDGNSVGFGPLARRLGPDQPFYALQPRGLDGRRLVDVAITKMAAGYVRDIRSVQRSGPYILGGRCFGTLVAFEMTRLLESAGEEVSLVIALDSVGPLWEPRTLANGLPFDEVMNLARCYEPDADPARGPIFTSVPAAEEFIDWLREPVERDGVAALTRYVAAAYRARPDLQAAYPLGAEGSAGLVDWTWIGGRSEMGMNPALLPAAPPSVREWPTSKDPRYRSPTQRLLGRAADWADVMTTGRVAKLSARRQDRLLELAARMVLEYRAGPCAAPVALIRSEEYRHDGQLARWYGLETGGVDEFYVEGSHQSMMREPDVGPLARCVEGCIDRVVARGLVATG
jgi:thioesterase domain-containing protein/acyl carrier protein